MRTGIVIAWLPLLMLPTGVMLLARDALVPWAFMWLLAAAIFVGCKWLTWYTASLAGDSWRRQFGYLALWPGLDAAAFFHTPNARVPSLNGWLFAVGKLGFGVGLIWGVVPFLPREHALLRGWVGMVGIVFVLHFGLFHLLSLEWQALGVTAKPLMNWPMLATSVSEFWGQRWNTAFRDLTYRFLFRPLIARCGATIALIIGFLVSGTVHDLVISLPARRGYGGPTAFFLLQAAAILLERSTCGQRLGLAHGGRGWAFTMLVLVGPMLLLFHPPFVRTVVVPFVDWLTGAADV